MSKRSECIGNTSYTKDGIRIDGHAYVALLAFNDKDSDRWYYVDRCENCGHSDVAFSSNDAESKHYPEVTHVGGSV